MPAQDANGFDTDDLTDTDCGHDLIGLGIELIEKYFQWNGPKLSNLHLVEFFAGCARFSGTARDMGFSVSAFDKLLHPSADICKLSGFVLAGILVCLIVPGGLLWASPQCSSWLQFVSLANHKRGPKNLFWGNASRPDVCQGNAAAVCLAYLIGLATLRGVRVAVENPAGSFLWKFPVMAMRIKDARLRKYITYGGAFGWSTLKPFNIMTNVPAAIMRRIVVRTAKQARLVLKSNGKSPKGGQSRQPRFPYKEDDVQTHDMLSSAARGRLIIFSTIARCPPRIEADKEE